MQFFEEIRLAEKNIRPYLPKTPLIRCYALEHDLGLKTRIFLKCENLQWTNTFKPRGAFNALLQLSRTEKKQGVIARSSGNFAQGLSYAGSILNIPITIVMPATASQLKKENTAKYGARILFSEKGHHADEQKKVVEIAQKEDLAVLSPFDHLHVIAGAGTIALEIWESLPTITQFFCQVGGGGLMAGTATTFKSLNPLIETIGIEPEGANDFFLSRREGHRVRNDHSKTIADGLRAPQVGELNWPLLHNYVDKAATITDDQIKGALRYLYEKAGLCLEPSGAVSFAAMLYHPELLKQSGDAVCVLSGGNIDKQAFFDLINLD